MARPALWQIMLAVGVVLALIAAVVILVPLVPVPSGNKTVGEGDFAYFQVNSLVIQQGILVSWSSNVSLTVWIEDCGASHPSPGALVPCTTPTHGPKTATGTGGTISFSASAGDWVAVGTDEGNASISLTTTDAQGGLGALAFAIVLLFLAYRAFDASRQPPRGSKDEPKTDEEEKEDRPEKSEPGSRGEDERPSEPATEDAQAEPGAGADEEEDEKADGTR